MPALAQTPTPPPTPTVTACGLPTGGGEIRSSVTYTMTADCVLTGTIHIQNARPAHSVTINGGGHTITGGNFNFIESVEATLTLNDVTIDGENTSGRNHNHFIRARTVNATRVTFTGGNSPQMLWVTDSSLSNVLFHGNISNLQGISNVGSVMFMEPNSTHTWNNVVIRRNHGAGGAIHLRSGSTLTTTGCLTSYDNLPRGVYVESGATWTNSSTGRCSGAIGNGGQTAAAPSLLSCGFPAAGPLYTSATYTLQSNCDLTGPYYISDSISITVIGNGYTLRSRATGHLLRVPATSSLRLENVALAGLRLYNYGDIRAERIEATGTVNGILSNGGEARFTNALFADNTAPGSYHRSVAFADNLYQRGAITFTNATFRNNTGGLGVLATYGATILLNGCIVFESNSPTDTYIYANSEGVVTDNRDTNCANPVVDPVVPPSPQIERPVIPNASGDDDSAKSACNPHCASPPPEPAFEGCDLKLGAIGLVCRPRVQPPVAAVWRIRPNPAGAHLPAVGDFLLSVNQPQVEAAGEGLVACSPDGRLAIRTGLPAELRRIFENTPKYADDLRAPRRYIVISKGEEPQEGKVHNIVLDNALDGRVFGIVDTFGGPPAPECVTRAPAQPAPQPPTPTPAPVYAAAFVEPQAAQPDGSIIHVVQTGDVLDAIAVAYGVDPGEIIQNNQLANRGRWIYPGQQLLIRAAS
ncbi:MAG: LysM domain-containing protein [Chloroflexi bacterium]|nr:LysM domain-containing protein [Chloroflexota bacterium]